MNESELPSEVRELRRLLDEANSTLDAIREGEVDALVIGGKEIYTLEGADHPYRVLVEAMQPGAVTVNPDGMVVYCNAGFSKMTGNSVEKMVGHGVTGLFLEADRLLLNVRLAEEGVAKPVELTLLREGNEEGLPVLVTFNSLPLAGMRAVCLVVTDLTEHRHNLHLQDTDRRKDEFLAMLAHEIRNPLAPIANAAKVLQLRNRDEDKETTWACEVIERQVQQLTRIVDDLLDVSRITRGKIKLQMGQVNVSAIISAAVETSRPLIESRGHQLHITLDPELLEVHADTTRMAQVITNLLNNAAKYTDEGGEIRLTTKREGEEALISVRDSGTGVPPEMLPRLFELFTQVDRTIDRSQGGLGIGLTLVRSLVELHHGSVSAHSDGLGKGSEFVVRLPLVKETGRVSAEDGSGEEGTKSKVTHRVLVVDDNVDSARSLAMMMSALGHETEVAHDGPGAIEAAEQFRPTLILLDIGLPGMNGYVVAERLRMNPEMRRVCLAALTGYGEEQDRRRSKEAGFDRHFVKPVELDELQELIRGLPREGCG